MQRFLRYFAMPRGWILLWGLWLVATGSLGWVCESGPHPAGLPRAVETAWPAGGWIGAAVLAFFAARQVWRERLVDERASFPLRLVGVLAAWLCGPVLLGYTLLALTVGWPADWPVEMASHAVAAALCALLGACLGAWTAAHRRWWFAAPLAALHAAGGVGAFALLAWFIDGRRYRFGSYSGIISPRPRGYPGMLVWDSLLARLDRPLLALWSVGVLLGAGLALAWRLRRWQSPAVGSTLTLGLAAAWAGLCVHVARVPARETGNQSRVRPELPAEVSAQASVLAPWANPLSDGTRIAGVQVALKLHPDRPEWRPVGVWVGDVVATRAGARARTGVRSAAVGQRGADGRFWLSIDVPVPKKWTDLARSSLELDGRVQFQQFTRIATLPVRAGAHGASHGWRATLLGITTPQPTGSALKVAVECLRPPDLFRRHIQVREWLVRSRARLRLDSPGGVIVVEPGDQAAPVGFRSTYFDGVVLDLASDEAPEALASATLEVAVPQVQDVPFHFTIEPSSADPAK